jgi:hypothetical protein
MLMPTDVYRYRLDDAVPAADAEATLVLSILAVEALHGEAQARLDAAHAFDAKLRTVVIDATTPVGRDFNRLFLGFLSREFGPGSFRVERVAQSPTPEPTAA